LLSKGGIIDGFCGYISYMPQDKIGIVVLANNRKAYSLTHYLNYYIYDQLLDLKEFSWESIIQDEKPTYEETSGKSNKLGNKPEKIPYPIDTYTGSYENAAYGHVEVDAENGELRLNFNKSLVYPLEYAFQNTFKTELWGTPVRVEFSPDLQRNVTKLEIDVEGIDFNIVFNKISE
jgi:hypothetical protein